MLEEYYKYKVNRKKNILIIKCGNFYEVIDKDALIISRLFGYKISKLSDTFKCGFPIPSLDKVVDILNYNEINYAVIENNKIIVENSFDENKYDDFKFNINNIKYNFLRISKITKYLNENAYQNINELLDSIEGSINERR